MGQLMALQHIRIFEKATQQLSVVENLHNNRSSSVRPLLHSSACLLASTSFCHTPTV